MVHANVSCMSIWSFLVDTMLCWQRCVLKISEAVVRRRCIRDANRIDAVLPYDTRREKASSHKLTLTKRFNMALLTMSFCYSSMASEDRYEYAVAVINRETDIWIKLNTKGVKSAQKKLKKVDITCMSRSLIPLCHKKKRGEKIKVVLPINWK